MVGQKSFNMNNVLIIEDDKEICVMIKDHLEKYNYQVFFTLTGANAIERIKELSPDLIILDLMLPFISGDELIRNIRKFSDVPVIVVSAKSLTFNKVELLRLGADDYLTKPFDLDELLARIERNLLRSQKDGNPMYYWMNFSSCRTMGIIEHLPFYFIGCISLLIVGGLIMIRKEIK